MHKHSMNTKVSHCLKTDTVACKSVNCFNVYVSIQQFAAVELWMYSTVNSV